MAKELVDRGGFFLLGGEGEPGSLFGGTQVFGASLVRTLTTINLTATGDDFVTEQPLRRQYELAGTAYVSGAGLFALADLCYATYYAQSTDPAGQFDQVLFHGQVIVVRVADAQQQGAFETQEIALRSSGKPDIG